MTKINQKLLVSGAEYFDNLAQINPYYADESVDVARAVAEHQSIVDLFAQAGIEVVSAGAPATSQDGVYSANWALVRGQRAVLARLPVARQSEEAYAEAALRDLGYEVIHQPTGLKFSGQGDALACGDYLFCGQGYRSDAEAQAYAADALGYQRIQLQTVPQLDSTGRPVVNATSGWADSFYYDIDLALAIVAGPSGASHGTIAYCPAAFTPESQQTLAELEGFDKIIVSEAEARQAFACNLVSTGQAVIMSDRAPELRSALERRGLEVLTPSVHELVKGGGYIRCVSLALN